ncbi:hypothetical protein DRH29_04825 [candidate division Kazan bacterium]|uniref:Holin n=1 Tax=candidate division Kazan bacterium TaxID=2202143 RepID=A0A420ZBH0_UNCK3|nr:MAG: hypothetical protein DRH29_04825 [candidate division Kazan bacterium]
MRYSFKEGLKRSLRRAVKLSLIAAAIAGISTFMEAMPPEMAYLAPILTGIVGFLEKLERNYREVKKRR